MQVTRLYPRQKDIFSNLFDAQKELSGIWSNFADETVGGTSEWHPSTDIAENKDAFMVYVELPGMKKEDVKITLQQNILTIQGEKKSGPEPKEDKYHRVERNFGKFTRSFRLTSRVIGETVEANYKDGVLSIRIPKAEEAKPKEIEIKF